MEHIKVLVIIGLVSLFVGCGGSGGGSESTPGSPQNTAPVANAGPDQNAVVSDLVTLNGTGSTDVNGNTLTYLWTITTKPSGSLAALTNESTANPTFIPDLDGSYVAQLIVNDGTVDSTVDTVTITVGFLHNGVFYSTRVSPVTGRVWLDRNVGATKKCTESRDSECFGGYYQWGRGTDGHENNNSFTTVALVDTIFPEHGDFILISSTPYDWMTADSDGALRSSEWSKTDGSSICPAGYRVPTITELQAESISTGDDAFTKLWLPSAGSRSYGDGDIDNQGNYGLVWSSSPDGVNAQLLYFDSGNAGTSYSVRANGVSVRCLKD